MLERPRESGQPADIAPYLDIRKAVAPAVSYDGELIAYLSDESGTNQVWIKPAAGGAAWRLTDLPEPVGAIAFNPKSRDLLLTMDCGGDERYQLLLSRNASSIPIALTDDPTTVHAWGCWAPDGLRIAYASNARDRTAMDIHVMDTASGDTRCVYEGVGYRTPAAFFPDGEALLVIDSTRAMNDQDLCRLDLSTGAYETLTPHRGRARYLSPKVLKDGSGIMMISDQEREFLAIAHLPAGTAELQPVLELPEQDIETFALSSDQSRLACVANREGWNRIVLADRDGAHRKELQPPMPCVIGSVAWAPDATYLILPAEGAATPPDIWRCNLQNSAFERVTSTSKAGVDIGAFIEPRVERVTSFDRLEVPYLVYEPVTPEPPNGYPAMIIVHGGPESQWKPDFRADVQYMLARGILVAAPNVRGSTGYGRRYQHLDDREKRMDSVADLKAVRLALGSRSDVDESRIGVFGRSYGGFMVLSAMTEYPELWHLGVEFYGIANFITLLQTTGPWRRHLRAAEYGDTDAMKAELERFSPINRIEAVAARLMIAQGLDDPRVTPGESEMVFSCLRGLGKPVEYLRIPHEGHGFARLENRHRVFGALARFLETHL